MWFAGREPQASHMAAVKRQSQAEDNRRGEMALRVTQFPASPGPQCGKRFEVA